MTNESYNQSKVYLLETIVEVSEDELILDSFCGR